MSQSNKNTPLDNKKKKTNNFKSLKILFNNMKSYRIALFSVILLAFISSALLIYTPKKMSELTDHISSSIKLDDTKMQNLIKEISVNVQTRPNQDLVFDNKKITYEDQVKFMKSIQTLGPNFSSKKQLSKEQQEEILDTFRNIPQSISEIIEPKTNLEKIKEIAILILVLYVVSSILSYIQAYILANVANDYAFDLRKKIGDKINALPLNYFDTNQVGDIISRMTNDVDTISMSLNQSLGTLASATTLLLGSTLMMFITNWTLALVAIGSSLIGFILIGVIMANSQKYFKLRQESIGSLNGHIEEVFSGINIIKSYNATKQSYTKFTELNENLYNANIKSKFLSSLMHPIMMFVGNLGYLAVSIVGAVLTSENIITFGVIIAFMTYVRLFTNPLTQLAQSVTSLQSSAAAGERVFSFLAEEELKDEKYINLRLDLNEVEGKIEFKNVVFKYPSNDKPTIKGFSATALPGQKIAIVGPTGAGKSTMVNLLMKFYEISEGDILIDGHSINDISRENIHDLFTMILQDTWLFNGTIRENITYNMEDVTDEELNILIKFIGLDHFIKTLPNNIDTVIKDNESVSAGQRQLLTIARGMLKDAPFLILDEATSNVDTRTEETIQEAMDKLMVGKTSFIIAHRLSTIINADLILVMNEGNIIEQGTHEELLAKNGFYADLYNSQFSL
ncbi:ABC transporter ATP-binding protein [Helcococcus kunzii]|uniref:ABC transporter ATP-binding protein n=1 Tax=Helcococcus kunzii TaxID=40091 RepID=UPI0021A5B076|nr:ABC transporter ATP-binding protein [Helcococcus kunzii]MCT1795651.1 ABC transporter ATP-binding protein/permease [Helcococcus kunzii]MCT1988783.1 ABC transporter ATP-binding protein/permease [Helcococcus kunzii]